MVSAWCSQQNLVVGQTRVNDKSNENTAIPVLLDLLKLKERRMNAPKLAIGDGAMAFRAALEEVFAETRQQRCWMHKTMNVLNSLTKLSQPKAKLALHNIWQAETRFDAQTAFDLLIKIYESKYPKAALCLQKDCDELMVFSDFPA